MGTNVTLRYLRFDLIFPKEKVCDATRVRDLRQVRRVRIQRESLEGAHAPPLRRESASCLDQRGEAPRLHALPAQPDEGRAHGAQAGAGSPLARWSAQTAAAAFPSATFS